MRFVYRRLSDILVWQDTAPTELGLALIAITRGLWLLWPSYDTLGSDFAHAVVAQVFTDNTLGALLLGMGAAQVYGLMVKHHSIRQWSAFVATAVWFGYAAVSFAAAPLLAGIPVHICVALGCAWVHLRAWRYSSALCVIERSAL